MLMKHIISFSFVVASTRLATVAFAISHPLGVLFLPSQLATNMIMLPVVALMLPMLPMATMVSRTFFLLSLLDIFFPYNHNSISFDSQSNLLFVPSGYRLSLRFHCHFAKLAKFDLSILPWIFKTTMPVHRQPAASFCPRRTSTIICSLLWRNFASIRMPTVSSREKHSIRWSSISKSTATCSWHSRYRSFPWRT